MIPSWSIDFFEWEFLPVTFFWCCQEIGTYSKILEQLFHIVNVHRWSHTKSMCRFPCFQRKCYQKNWVSIINKNISTFIEKNTLNFMASCQMKTINREEYIMIFAKTYLQFRKINLVYMQKSNYENNFLNIHLVVYFI